MKTSTYQSEASKFLDVPVITWVLFCLMCMLSWKGGRQAKHGNNTENLMERPWSKSPFCASRKLPAHLLGWPHDSCDIVGERQYVQPVNLHVLQQTTKISGCMPLSQSESKRMPIATTSVQASCEASEQDHQITNRTTGKRSSPPMQKLEHLCHRRPSSLSHSHRVAFLEKTFFCNSSFKIDTSSAVRPYEESASPDPLNVTRHPGK